MKKKLIAGVLALTLVMGSGALPSGMFENVADKAGITASAYDQENALTSGSFKYTVLKDVTVSILAYTGKSASVTIPTKISGKKVTSISAGAFYNNKTIKSVKIPNGIKEILIDAFYGCTNLKSVTIPKSVTNLGYMSFGYVFSVKENKYLKISGFKITCYYNSAAGTYVRYNKIPCKYINYIGNNTVKLSKTSYPYSSKANKPAVTIMCGKTKLKKGTDYTVSYKNNTAIGTATAVINGKGKFNGTKNVTFKINPKKQTAKLTSGNDSFKAAWTKDTQATGYQIKYATNAGFKNAITVTSGKTTTSKLIKGKNKTTYYAKVRTYKTVKGTKYYGAWSTVKTVKTK